MDVTLVMFKSDGARRDFPLAKPRIIIGRKNTCDLRIPLNSVSRQHCELLIDGDSLRIRDLGSSNGTFHNHGRVQEAVLAPGDELVIGPVVFTVIVDGVPEQIEPVRTVLVEDSDTGQSPALSGMYEQVIASLDTDKATPPESADAKGSAQAAQLDDPIAALEALADAEDAEDNLVEFDFLADDDDH
jgi:pSer/pThr/pTyr-binding forkhead associated (FHA) protein